VNVARPAKRVKHLATVGADRRSRVTVRGRYADEWLDPVSRCG